MPFIEGWKFYIPEDGDTADQATKIIGLFADAEDAANIAIEADWNNTAGERGLDRKFDIVIIAPDGVETVFAGHSEASVEHWIQEKD